MHNVQTITARFGVFLCADNPPPKGGEIILGVQLNFETDSKPIILTLLFLVFDMKYF
jgi:hypothetical protein